MENGNEEVCVILGEISIRQADGVGSLSKFVERSNWGYRFLSIDDKLSRNPFSARKPFGVRARLNRSSGSDARSKSSSTPSAVRM
jgi:hypothetical protein